MPSRCQSLYSTDEFSSLEPSRLFGSHLAPVIAADGPSSSHPPSSSNGVVFTPHLDDSISLARIPLAHLSGHSLDCPWGPSFSWPAPSSSSYLLALAFSWSLPFFICLGHWTRTVPSSMDSCTFILSYQLDLSPGREYRDVQ